MKILSAFIFAGLLSLTTLTLAHEHQGMAGELKFNNGVHAHLFWEQGPQENAESVLRIEFMNAATHSPTEVIGVPKVSLWMPDMGHGSSPTALQRVLDPNGQIRTGVYRVLNIYFVMSGVWEVRVELNNADGSTETQSFEVNINGGGHHH